MPAFAACVGSPFRHNLLEDQGFTVLAVSRIKDATPETTFRLKPARAVAFLVLG